MWKFDTFPVEYTYCTINKTVAILSFFFLTLLLSLTVSSFLCMLEHTPHQILTHNGQHSDYIVSNIEISLAFAQHHDSHYLSLSRKKEKPQLNGHNIRITKCKLTSYQVSKRNRKNIGQKNRNTIACTTNFT